MRHPKLDEIRAYRDKHECGLDEATRELTRRARFAHLQELRSKYREIYTLEQAGDAIREIIDLLMEDCQP